MGEGYPFDAQLMPYISSANIACCFHAGDVETMKRTVDLCMQHHVAIGAHVSLPDRENFGRIDLIDVRYRPEDLPEILTEQIELLQKICSEAGAAIYHLKPHGALYNRAAWDGVVASFICSTMQEVNGKLVLYGLSGSQMSEEAAHYGLKFMSEVFADRAYTDDGMLVPRTQANALITETGQAVRQVLQMIQHGQVLTIHGNNIAMKAETVCIHGDGQHAVEFAGAIREELLKNSIEITHLL
jgi:5-oxoprolinase (ATP-hydrolysing) subunit A